MTSAEISEDSSLLSAGASDSVVRIWSLNSNKLKAMKPASELEQVDKEAGMVTSWNFQQVNFKLILFKLPEGGPVFNSLFFTLWYWHAKNKCELT